MTILKRDRIDRAGDAGEDGIPLLFMFLQRDGAGADPQIGIGLDPLDERRDQDRQTSGRPPDSSLQKAPSFAYPSADRPRFTAISRERYQPPKAGLCP